MKTLTIRIDDETEEAIADVCNKLIDDAETIGHKRSIIKAGIAIHKKQCKDPDCEQNCAEYQQKALNDLDTKERFVDFVTRIHAGLLAQE